MKYARLWVNYRTDEKIQQLSTTQRMLFLDLICWSVDHETGGRIPTSALPAIGQGHKYVLRSLSHMTEIGLLVTVNGSGSEMDRTGIGNGWEIKSFPKYQMKTEAKYPKGAGQKQDSDRASRAPAPARTGTRPDIYISQLEDQLAPGELTEVRDPRLAASLDRIGKQVEGKMNGSGG